MVQRISGCSVRLLDVVVAIHGHSMRRPPLGQLLSVEDDAAVAILGRHDRRPPMSHDTTDGLVWEVAILGHRCRSAARQSLRLALPQLGSVAILGHLRGGRHDLQDAGGVPDDGVAIPGHRKGAASLLAVVGQRINVVVSIPGRRGQRPPATIVGRPVYFTELRSSAAADGGRQFGIPPHLVGDVELRSSATAMAAATSSHDISGPSVGAVAILGRRSQRPPTTTAVRSVQVIWLLRSSVTVVGGR